MSNKFKVGDKVRSLTTGGYGTSCVAVGDLGIVTTVNVNGCDVKFPNFSYELFMYPGEIEPAGESELERLVRIANEGIDAAKLLDSKYSKQIDSYFEGKELKYRVKRTPAPITLSTGWRVELRDSVVMVGCQEFRTKELYDTLYNLCRGVSADTLGSEVVEATRKGIEWCDEMLPWDDADRLLAYLESAGE